MVMGPEYTIVFIMFYLCLGGGMMAMNGGSFMSGMPSMGGSAFSSVNQATQTKTDCIGVELCKSTCQGTYTIGPVGSDGCPSCECNSATGKDHR